MLITTALLSGPAAVLSAAQPAVPIANNPVSTDRPARRAAISLFAEESATEARRPPIVGDPLSVWGRGGGWCGPRAVVATVVPPPSGLGTACRVAAGADAAGAGGLRPRGLGEARTARPGSRRVRVGQARVRVRPGTVRERAARPPILSTSSQVPVPTEKLASSARTRPRRLPADIFCRSFTKRSSDTGPVPLVMP